MAFDTLKARARNLRNALAEVHRLKLTHSQSLELVAREENFPNWDAACASFKAPGVSTPATGLLYATDVMSDDIRQMLSPYHPMGCLIVVWGVTGQGKTSTAMEIINNLLTRSSPAPTSVLHAGPRVLTYPETLKVRDIPEGQSILQGGRITENLIVVDDLRDAQNAYEVVSMVLAGAGCDHTACQGKSDSAPASGPAEAPRHWR